MDIANNFLFGRYKEKNTSVHRIDPRIKLMFMLLMSLTLFAADDIPVFAVSFFLFIFTFILSRMNLLTLLKGIMPVIWLIGITFVLHAAIPPGDLFYAFIISCRLALIFMWATMLTVTTKSIDLARALAWFTQPLRCAGVSPPRIAFVFSMSLRFFPIVLDEAQQIINSQKLRAEKIGFIKRLEAFCTAFMFRMMKKAARIEHALTNRELRLEQLKTGMDFRRYFLLNTAVFAVMAGYILFFIYRG